MKRSQAWALIAGAAVLAWGALWWLCCQFYNRAVEPFWDWIRKD